MANHSGNGGQIRNGSVEAPIVNGYPTSSIAYKFDQVDRNVIIDKATVGDVWCRNIML